MAAKRALDYDALSTPKKAKLEQQHPTTPTSSNRLHPQPLTPTQLKTHKPTSNIDVDGFLVTLSPIQNKRFVGELVDGNCSIDLVGWDPQKHSALDKVFNSPSKTDQL